jgi:hypothetical protein
MTPNKLLRGWKYFLLKGQMLWSSIIINHASLKIVKIDKIVTRSLVLIVMIICEKPLNSFFFMNNQCSRMPPSRTIYSNSTFGGNNSLKVITHKTFSCKRNSNFIFHVWKLLPFNFSILWASKVDFMILSRRVLKIKTPKALKLLTKC